MVDPASLVLVGAVSLAAGLAGPTKRALGKLIGGLGDIGAAKLKAREQAVHDKTAADSALSKALAKAAADRAVSDPELVGRTLERMAREELSKQENREAVARIALEYLSALKPEEIPASAPDVDEDWLNFFGSHAERATSAHLRDLWGRVLAGEIRKPGAFSPLTIQMLSVLDGEVAKSFENLSVLVVNGDQIFLEADFHSGLKFREIKELASAGLVFDDFTSHNTFDENNNSFGYSVGPYVIILDKPQGVELNIPVLLLTKAGREIYSLIDCIVQPSDIERLAKFLKAESENKARVRWGTSIQAPDGRTGVRDAAEIPDQPPKPNPFLSFQN